MLHAFCAESHIVDNIITIFRSHFSLLTPSSNLNTPSSLVLSAIKTLSLRPETYKLSTTRLLVGSLSAIVYLARSSSLKPH
jgi:hypothetical protein